MIVKDDKVWFCLADACKALEIRNPSQVKARLDFRGVTTSDVSTNNKNRQLFAKTRLSFNFICLYGTIAVSKKKGVQNYFSNPFTAYCELSADKTIK